MINTDVKARQLSTTLQLIDLNIEQIQRTNFDSLKEQFINLQNKGASGLINFYVGLNDMQDVVIAEDDYEQLFGVKKVDYHALIRGQQDIDKIVKKLMTNYISWLKLQYKNQTNIDNVELYKLMHNKYHVALFTDTSFTDYLSANLDNINGNLITEFQTHIKRESLKKYFMNSILCQLGEIHTIKSSAINAILELITGDRYMHKNKALDIEIMITLYNAIIHSNSSKLTIDFDMPLEYMDLILDLPVSLKHNLKLPLSAIPGLINALTLQNIPADTTFILIDKKDLQILINELLKLSSNVDINRLLYYKDLCIKLTNQDKKIIFEMIEVINNTFANTEKLQQVVPILEQIVNQES